MTDLSSVTADLRRTRVFLSTIVFYIIVYGYFSTALNDSSILKYLILKLYIFIIELMI